MLSYTLESQGEKELYEYHVKVVRVPCNYGGSRPLLARHIERPKGMHRTTFDRLALELYVRRDEPLGVLAAWTDQLNDRQNVLSARSRLS